MCVFVFVCVLNMNEPWHIWMCHGVCMSVRMSVCKREKEGVCICVRVYVYMCVC